MVNFSQKEKEYLDLGKFDRWYSINDKKNWVDWMKKCNEINEIRDFRINSNNEIELV